MYTLQVDDEANDLQLQVTGEVDGGQLLELRSSAIVASRELDGDFRLVTDVSDCEGFQCTVAEHLQQLYTHLESFGLVEEVRVVGEETPQSVEETLDRAARGFSFERTTVGPEEKAEGNGVRPGKPGT